MLLSELEGAAEALAESQANSVRLLSEAEALRLQLEECEQAAAADQRDMMTHKAALTEVDPSIQSSLCTLYALPLSPRSFWAPSGALSSDSGMLIIWLSEQESMLTH